MVPADYVDQALVPPPAYHRGVAATLHVDALTLVRRLQLLELCRPPVGGWSAVETRVALT